MLDYATERPRDLQQEDWEQRRYAFLEQLYMLTGENCEQPVSPQEIEADLEISPAAHQTEVDDLVQLGYVQYADVGGGICITEKGIAYLQIDAWRRRSVRD